MDLLNLPREIRDRIYLHLFSPNYMTPIRNAPPCARTHLAILRASKSISDEALSALYLHSTFRIFTEAHESSLSRGLLSSPEHMSRFMNDIVVEVDMETYCNSLCEKEEFLLNSAYWDTWRYLVQLRHPRKTCQIVLRESDWECFCDLRNPTIPGCHGIKWLVGFETVILKFRCPTLVNGKGIRPTTVEFFDELIDRVHKALGLHLGPALISQSLRWRCLEFRPQEYSAQRRCAWNEKALRVDARREENKI